LIPASQGCSAARRRDGTRRFDTTEHNLRSTLSKQTSGGTIDKALACQERKCFVRSGVGVSYPCIFFSRI